MTVYGVIMAGGIGSRFWPQSRKNYPKQLLNVFGGETLIQQTYDRLLDISEEENILIVTNQELVSPIIDQIPRLTKDNFVVEPMGKNTAPCIILAALQIAQKDPDGVMVIVPADHLIMNREIFTDILNKGIDFAFRNDALVTIGITPTHPETGYGYIQRSEQVEKIDDREIFRVKTFAEKPDIDTAKRFLQTGDFYWNSGMFIWKASSLLTAVENFLPEIYEEFLGAFKFWGKEEFAEKLEIAYKKIKGISIDYGVMQNARNVFVIPGTFAWNDVGSWDVVSKLAENSDENGNKVQGAESALIDTNNTFIMSSGKFVATVGIDDLIIIDTDDALLICKKGMSQNVKEVVDYLKLKGLNQYL